MNTPPRESSLIGKYLPSFSVVVRFIFLIGDRAERNPFLLKESLFAQRIHLHKRQILLFKSIPLKKICLNNCDESVSVKHLCI